MPTKAIAFGVVCIVTMAAAMTGCSQAGNETITPANAEQSVPITMLWRGNETLSPAKQHLLQKKIKEKLNVDLTIQQYDKNHYETKAVSVWSRANVPDIVWLSSELIRGAVLSGSLLPLDDLVKSSPVWSGLPKPFYADSTYGGKIYSLPQFIQAPDSIYYRADWAEKLRIKPPSNAEELYAMLYAFAKNDPDGDGKANTAGFTLEGDLSRSGPLWKMFLPTSPRKLALYVDPDDDAIKSAYLSVADMKRALLWFRRAYAEGVLDKEWVLEKSQTAEDKFTSGKTGIWIRGAEMIAERYDKMKAQHPNASIASIPVIKGRYGPNYTVRAGYSSSYVITSATPYPRQAKQVLDYLLGPEGTIDTMIGFEGQTYKVVDGKLQWLVAGEEKYYNPGAVVFSVHSLKLPEPIPILEQNKTAVRGFKTELNVNMLYIPRSERASGKAPEFEKLALEYVSKIITGQYAVDKYDEFAAAAKRMGLEAIVKEINDLYKQDKKQVAGE